MLCYGAQNNAFNLQNAVIESLTCYKRAGLLFKNFLFL